MKYKLQQPAIWSWMCTKRLRFYFPSCATTRWIQNVLKITIFLQKQRCVKNCFGVHNFLRKRPSIWTRLYCYYSCFHFLFKTILRRPFNKCEIQVCNFHNTCNHDYHETLCSNLMAWPWSYYRDNLHVRFFLSTQQHSLIIIVTKHTHIFVKIQCISTWSADS